ncbi:hypothetical protein [Stenotrophomonas sp. VV52]|uniref:hypothetical protein n=1 Tax=Stenotrophomonas sp. VV52 TaxID=2066958 RepID=UPI0011AF33AB|nr:hypothetical protein [Stenotrophomonas sp. VV52]
MSIVFVSAILAGCRVSPFPDSSRDADVLAEQKQHCEPPSVEIVKGWGMNGVSTGCYIQIGDFSVAKDGYIQLRGHYAGGRRTGKWRWFTPDGNVMNEVEYRPSDVPEEGSSDGPYISATNMYQRPGRGDYVEILHQEEISCPTPAVKMLRPWSNGNSIGCYVKHGTFYYVEGSYLHIQAKYVDGREAGIWTVYEEDGRVHRTIAH